MKTAVGRIIAVMVIGMVWGGTAVAQSTSAMKANIELMHKDAEVWSKGNMALADETYSKDIIRHVAGQPDSVGLESYKQILLGTRKAFPDWTQTVENVIASGDLVVSKMILSGTMTGAMRNMPPTGNSVKVPCASVYRIAEGKIAEIWVYYDSVLFLKAFGYSISPPPPPK